MKTIVVRTVIGRTYRLTATRLTEGWRWARRVDIAKFFNRLPAKRWKVFYKEGRIKVFYKEPTGDWEGFEIVANGNEFQIGCMTFSQAGSKKIYEWATKLRKSKD